MDVYFLSPNDGHKNNFTGTHQLAERRDVLASSAVFAQQNLFETEQFILGDGCDPLCLSSSLPFNICICN